MPVEVPPSDDEELDRSRVVVEVVELAKLDVVRPAVVDVPATLLLRVELDVAMRVAVCRTELLDATTRIVTGDTSTPWAYRTSRYDPAVVGAVAM